MKSLKILALVALMLVGSSAATLGQPYQFLNTLQAQESAAQPNSEAVVPAGEVKAGESKELKLPEPPAEKLVWIQTLMDFLNGIPAVGKILVVVFQVLMIVAVVATALGTMLLGLSKSLMAMGKQVPVLEKVAKVVEAVNKWVLYVSMYNVQKAKPEAGKSA